MASNDRHCNLRRSFMVLASKYAAFLELGDIFTKFAGRNSHAIISSRLFFSV
jgi:hypothetical protein